MAIITNANAYWKRYKAGTFGHHISRQPTVSKSVSFVKLNAEKCSGTFPEEFSGILPRVAIIINKEGKELSEDALTIYQQIFTIIIILAHDVRTIIIITSNHYWILQVWGRNHSLG